MRHIEALLRRHIGLDAASIGASLIERAVRLRMKQHGLTKPDAYHDLLATSRHELEQLIEMVVVTETWFFRDREPFNTIARLARHDWPARHPTSPLRILSLPCSSGEEPYSLAMALLDAEVPEAAFAIHAADISSNALTRAEQAVYGKNSFRGGELDFRDRHFSPTQEGYALSPLVRRCVKFERGNILDDGFLEGSAPYDFIFCRNLLIYFDPATQVLALGKLHRLLAADGVLFVGPAEMPLVVASGFINASLPMAFACHKATRNAGLGEGKAVPSAEGGMASAGTSHSAFRIPHSDDRSTIDPGPSPPTALELARQHADAGRFPEAVAICDAHLASQGPSAQAFYLLGLVKDARNDPAAITHYRKALYLEPNHYEALVHITLALEKSGDLEAARLYQRRAQRAQPKS